MKEKFKEWKEKMPSEDYYKLKDQYTAWQDAKYTYDNNITNDIYKTKSDLQRLLQFEKNKYSQLLNHFNEKYNLV